MKIGPVTVEIGGRRHRARPSRSHRPRLALGVVLASAALLALAVPAGADNAATGTVAVNPSAVRSITVSPTTFDYSACWATNGQLPVGNTMVMPNGVCAAAPTDGITITNGSAPATIEVQATAFVPSDGLNYPWSLCTRDSTQATALGVPYCSVPGLDQAQMALWGAPIATGSDIGTSVSGYGTIVGLNPACDTSFNYPEPASCSAIGGQSQTETPFFQAPFSSSDASASFSNTLTWTAVPTS